MSAISTPPNLGNDLLEFQCAGLMKQSENMPDHADGKVELRERGAMGM